MSRAPEFFGYWAYWVIVTVALVMAATVGALIAGWTGALIGAAAYLSYEVIVIYLSWGPRR